MSASHQTAALQETVLDGESWYLQDGTEVSQSQVGISDTRLPRLSEWHGLHLLELVKVSLSLIGILSGLRQALIR